MKNLNLLLVTLIFSSLLAGCGMKGPLYREAAPSPKVEQVTTLEANSNENETQATTQ
ncbi:LPS translocon maturation chaperone LptM [Psychromonas algicola]|uniref:LPS translocon maturation chaperone LptM n=1 Tax=Psychromonas algicola TaxID=2555642 RepID=UPI001419FAAE|nr:lipoprotein [Psychromonas sp. RZ5]